MKIQHYLRWQSIFDLMYKVKTGANSFDVVPTDDGILVNGELFTVDKVEIDPGFFHVLHKNKSYRVFLVGLEKESKKVTLQINNKQYEVQLHDKFDLLLEKMGMNNGSSGRMNTIKAPMPGLIVDVKVKEGDTVKTNDPLLVLEAMKMENVIKSPGDGIVRLMKVRKGESVEKNQILIEF